MLTNTAAINIQAEAETMSILLGQGDPTASRHLARLIEVDTQGVFQPFAAALAARLNDNLYRWAEIGMNDAEAIIEDEIYHLFKETAADWNGAVRNGDF